VQRRGAELSWSADWHPFATRLGYTFLDARFKTDFTNAQGVVKSGNRLPGVPVHSLFADMEARVGEALKVGLEMRVDSKVYVNDANTEAAPGYAVFNARAGYEFTGGPAKWLLYARIDNLLDKKYAGSVIVNEANRRFYEPAPGRRLFVGLRTMF
jgi:iron complex outermembrane receptor protein